MPKKFPISELKEKSQVDVMRRAMARNPGSLFATTALEGRLRRGDIDFDKGLGYKNLPPSELAGRIVPKGERFRDPHAPKGFTGGPSKDSPVKIEGFSLGKSRPFTEEEEAAMWVGEGELDPRVPHDAQVASDRRISGGRLTNKTTRTTDKARELLLVGATGKGSRDRALENFKTGTGEVPKDPRRRKLEVLSGGGFYEGEYPQPASSGKRMSRAQAAISPLEALREPELSVEPAQNSSPKKQTSRQKNKKTGSENSIARSVEARLRGEDLYVAGSEDLASDDPVSYSTHKISVSENGVGNRGSLVLSGSNKERLLGNLMKLEGSKRESTNVADDKRTEEQKKLDELERIRRSEYRKATFPSAISASSKYTGPGQMSQGDAKRLQYAMGEFASDLVPGGRAVKGAPDIVKAAMVPTPMNAAIAASHLVPTVAGRGLTKFLKGVKSTDDVLTAVEDPDAGGIAIASGVLGGKSPSLSRLKSGTKTMRRDEDPMEQPFIQSRSLSRFLGAQEAVAGQVR